MCRKKKKDRLLSTAQYQLCTSSHSMRLLLFTFYILHFTSLAGCVSTQEQRVQQLNEDGIFLYQKGDYVRAQESFHLAHTLKPDDPALIYNLGQCCDRQGKVKEAEKFYRLCFEKDENHVESKHALAQLLLLQGRRKEATDHVQMWLASQPKSADAYVQDAWRLRQDGDLLKAQARLHQALIIDPHHVGALLQMGILYEVMERPDRALVLYEKALREDPNRNDIRDHINKLLAAGTKQPLPDG